jgi:transcriptional regulator of arginine metabolism
MTPLTSKAARQQALLDILSKYEVTTQAEMHERMKNAGFLVTQATLSRDLDEIGARKLPRAKGKSVYGIPLEGDPSRQAVVAPDVDATQRLQRIANEVITATDWAANNVVVHTKPGAAHYLAGAIDRNSLSDVLGSIAGDDTVLIITRDASAAQRICENLLQLAAKKQS